MRKGIDLSITSWSEIKNQKFDIAILPWGATEPHNYHLPYGTDFILSMEVASEAAEKALKNGIRCMVLPPIPFGSQNPGQIDFPFCIHICYETQKSLLNDIVFSLEHQGLKKLLIVNGHGGNNFKNMIRDLAIEFPNFCIAVTDWYKVENRTKYFENSGEHADELETSVMLHYQPQWVLPLEEAGSGDFKSFTIAALRNNQVWIPRNWKKVSIDTGIGNPKASNAEKGQKFTEKVTDILSKFLFDFARSDTNSIYQ
jgi:creatinine amidohydrolase